MWKTILFSAVAFLLAGQVYATPSNVIAIDDSHDTQYFLKVTRVTTSPCHYYRNESREPRVREDEPIPLSYFFLQQGESSHCINLHLDQYNPALRIDKISLAIPCTDHDIEACPSDMAVLGGLPSSATLRIDISDHIRVLQKKTVAVDWAGILPRLFFNVYQYREADGDRPYWSNDEPVLSQTTVVLSDTSMVFSGMPASQTQDIEGWDPKELIQVVYETGLEQSLGDLLYTGRQAQVLAIADLN